jgi:hypothetical protein
MLEQLSSKLQVVAADLRLAPLPAGNDNLELMIQQTKVEAERTPRKASRVLEEQRLKLLNDYKMNAEQEQNEPAGATEANPQSSALEKRLAEIRKQNRADSPVVNRARHKSPLHRPEATRMLNSRVARGRTPSPSANRGVVNPRANLEELPESVPASMLQAASESIHVQMEQTEHQTATEPSHRRPS